MHVCTHPHSHTPSGRIFLGILSWDKKAKLTEDPVPCHGPTL
jgi:hypothetical protein